MNHLILLPHPGHPSAETTRYGSLAISLLKGPDSSSGCVAIWAVVDGVSCAISIGLLLDEDRLRSATALSQALERKIETFMEHETCRRPGLLRRPALQLVVMPGVTLSAELKAVEARTVEIAAREVEARVGLALPDFRVLWLDARVERAELAERYKLQESPETAVGQILNFHMNFLGFGPLNLKADEAGLVGQLEAQAAKLETLLQAAADPRASSDHEALAGVFSALRDLSWPRLGGPVPRESVHERPARGAAVVPMRLEVSGRHWREEPARLPLSTITLVYAANAAGKSTVVEALSLLASGLTRPRARMADPNESFEDVSLIGLGSALEDEPPPWTHADLLPVFSDDANLAEGRAGALGLFSLWAEGGHHETLSAVVRLSRALGAMADAKPQTLGVFARWNAGGSVRIPPAMASAILDGWAEEVPDGSPIIDPRRRKLQNVLKEALDAATVSGPRLGSFVEEWIEGVASRCDESPSAVSWAELIELLCRVGKSDRAGALLQARWGSAARARVAWQSTVDEDLEQFNIKLFDMDEIDRLQQLELALDQYLSHEVQRAPADQPRNTAAVVRLDLSRRFARMLALGGRPIPFLVMDEPTLGQHGAASARAIARLTRLARTFEGLAWSSLDGAATEERSGQGGETVPMAPAQWSLVERSGQGASPARAGWVGREPRPVRVRGSLIPTPVLVASYQRDALNAVAALEGQELDHPTRQALRALIPRAWRGAVSNALKRARGHWPGLLEGAREIPAPAMLAQAALDATLQCDLDGAPLTEKDLAAWNQEGLSGLERLGLVGLVGPQEIGGLGATMRRLLSWLACTGLLPAVLDDGEIEMDVSSVSFHELRYEGGDAPRLGATRLRRVSPAMMTLLDFPGVKREGVLLEGSDVADTGPLVLPPSAGAGDRTQEPQLTLTVVLHGFHSEQKNALLQTFMEYGIRVQILEETPEHPVDLEVRAIERFGDLVRMEVAGAEVDVVGWIGPWRRRVLEAAMGTLLERLREKRGEHFNVLLGLHTYPWTGELPDLRLDVSREADVSEHMNTTRLKLDSVYLALAAARPGLVRVKVLAPQWVSVLAGFTFRAVTNMPVAFLQGTGGGSDAEWRFDSADSAFAPPAAVIEGADAADADVLHLVVLCTSGGSIEAYWRWMGDDGRRIRRVMIVQEVVVPDGAAAARWADDLRRLIAENRPGATDISRLPPRIIRLFLAVPGGLAFALGRKLNALGKVSLTDFDREGQVYVAEVELVT